MKCRATRSMCALVLGAGICAGQLPQPRSVSARYVTVTIPHGIDSETVFIRYFLDDQFGGWVQQRSGISSYLINTTQRGRRATRIKAVLYAPGCAIQTFDLAISDSRMYSFVCHPLPAIAIAGALVHTDRLYGRDLRVEAIYVARWSQRLLGLGTELTTTIPVGDTVSFVADGGFRLPLPDLSQDPLAGSPDHSGDFQILARDKAGGKIIAQLVPEPEALRTRIGNLKIQNEYPSQITFVPCSAQGAQAHDSFGFAMRPDVRDACDR